MDASDLRTRTKEEAAAWFLELQSGEMSRAQRDIFIDWLRESPVHVAEMLRVTNVHEGLQSFRRWHDVDGTLQSNEGVISWLDSEARGEPKERLPSSSIRWRLVGTVAAALLVVSGLSLKVLTTFDNTLHTERGERREVVLSDGSVIQIDPETKLRIQFAAKTRQIALERGRAVFRIAKDPARPFQVKADDTLVRALGTAFGVELRRDGIKVTVSEGKVAIIGVNTLGRGETTPTAQDKDTPPSRDAKVLLTANEQVTVTSGGLVQPIRKVNSERELGWAQGRLIYEKEPLKTVIEDLNRYNQLQLHVTDTQLAARPISGVFDSSDPDSLLAFLSAVGSVTVTYTDNNTVAIAAAK